MMDRNPEYTAGEFRFLVDVQQVTYEPDGSGGQDKSWSTVFNFWAAIKETSGNENYSDSSKGRIRNERTWKFVTWFRNDINVEHRLLYDGKIFNIRKVEDLNLRRKFLLISAETGVEQ